jgi:hypothetical protein
LVIIGLLLGGVLKGQELIESAKVKNIGQDFRAISIAVLTYQDKYRALPGDDSKAATRWTGACASTGGVPGNGQIEGAWDAVASNSTGTESACAWDHLRRANLLTGDATSGAAPSNADGGRFGITSEPTKAAVLGVGGTLIVCAGNIRGRHVIPLDAMLDDGDPATGAMRATLANGTSPGTTALANNIDDNQNYNVCMGF